LSLRKQKENATCRRCHKVTGLLQGAPESETKCCVLLYTSLNAGTSWHNFWQLQHCFFVNASVHAVGPNVLKGATPVFGPSCTTRVLDVVQCDVTLRRYSCIHAMQLRQNVKLNCKSRTVLDRSHTCHFLAQFCRASFLARQSRKCDMVSRASFQQSRNSFSE